MYLLECETMPSKHIDKETWEMIEELKFLITENNQFATESTVLKTVLREGVKSVKEKENSDCRKK